MALNNLGLGFLVTAKDAASAVFDAVSSAIGGTDKRAKELQQTFGEVASEARSLGLKLTGFGLAGLAGLGVAGHAASEYNAAIAEVASITDRANFPIEVMKNLTQEMATTYGGDLTEHVKALYQAASSGAQTAAQAQQLLNAANLLAVGGLSNSFQAVDALTNIVNAYGMTLDQTTDIADAMFVAVKVGKTDINQLAQSIGDLAPIANLAGVGMADMFSAVAAASNQLGSGTKAITGMRAALTAILDPSTKASDEAKRLGIEFTRAHLTAVGFPAFLKEITGASGYTVDSLAKLFGSVEAIGAIAALTGNEGKGLTDAIDAMGNRAGAADAAFRTMADAAQFAEKRLKANLQVALVKIGEVLLPVIEGTLRAVNEMLDAFNRSPAILKQVVVGLIAAASVGALLVGGLLLLSGAIAGAMAAGEVAVAVFAGAAQALGVFALVAAAAGLAVAGFREAIDKNVGGLGDYVEKAFGKVKLAYEALTQLFEDGGFSGAVRDAFGGGANADVESFVTQVFLVFSRLQNLFDGVIDGFNGTVDAMGPTMAELTNALKGLGTVFGLAQDGPSEASAAFAKFGDVGRAVGGVLAGAFELLVKVFTAVVNVGRGVIGGFKQMGPVVDTVFGAVGNLFTALGRIGGIFGSLGGNTSSATSGFEMFGHTVGMVAGVVGYAVAGIVNAVTTMVDIVTAYVGGVVGVFNGLVGGFRAGFDIIYGLFTGDWDRMWLGAKGVVYSFAQIVVSIITTMVGTVASLLDGLGRAFGKDLGLRAAVDGVSKDMMKDLAGSLGMPTAAAGGERAPKQLDVLSGAGPGRGAVGAQPSLVAAQEAGAATGAAEAAAAAPVAALGTPSPINLTSNVRLLVDGATMAEVVVKQNSSDAARAHGPMATAT